MPVKYELMVPSGQYPKDGETKTRWLKVGVEFTSDKGPSIKLDCVPTSIVDRDGNTVAWDGWLNCFEPRPRDSAPRQAPQQAPEATGDFDGDVPF
jgi:hypothetical protein